MSAITWFDRIADSYEARTARGLVGWMRRRERATVHRVLDARPGHSVLDAGCGPGAEAAAFVARGCAVQAFDVSEPMVRVARARGVSACVADLRDADLGRTFDRVLCWGAIEHCGDPPRAVATLARHLAPGGFLVLVFTLPGIFGAAYAAWHATHGVHLTLSSLAALETLLGRHGLRVARGVRATPSTMVLRAERPA